MRTDQYDAFLLSVLLLMRMTIIWRVLRSMRRKRWVRAGMTSSRKGMQASSISENDEWWWRLTEDLVLMIIIMLSSSSSMIILRLMCVWSWCSMLRMMISIPLELRMAKAEDATSCWIAGLLRCQGLLLNCDIGQWFTPGSRSNLLYPMDTIG